MKKILLIDDNPINNNILINTLKKKYEVDVAMYLNGATRKLFNNFYDLIILDVMMPTQNLNWTKEMETGYFYFESVIKPMNRNIPVLFWSRLSEDSFNIYFRDKSMENIKFEHKNPEEKKFLEIIRNIIGK